MSAVFSKSEDDAEEGEGVGSYKDYLLESVTCESIATLVRQCDKSNQEKCTANSKLDTLSSNDNNGQGRSRFGTGGSHQN